MLNVDIPRLYLPQKSNVCVSTIFSLIDHISKSWQNLRPLNDYVIFLKLLIDKYGLEYNYLAKEAVEKNIKRGFILQHDIDINILSALNMAEIEYDLGIRSTYYILHNAFYYCFWGRGTCYRHEAMIHVYRQLQDDYGHEVGIHIDPLDISLNRGIDGKQAVIDEITWLRNNGIRIESMAAHNSWEAYGGANNWEIFTGRNSKDSHQGIPLGTIDETDWGIKCEAYDVLRKIPTLFISVLYNDQYTVKTVPFSNVDSYKANSDETAHLVNTTEKPILITAHPFYYRHEIKKQVNLVHVLSLTKTGTTLLLMLMASDANNNAFALGHATKFYRDLAKLENICMYHRPVCYFWKHFSKLIIPGENLLLQVVLYAGATHILGENFQFEMDTDLIADLRDPRINIIPIFNIRDGRGVCASYWRINPHLPFESVVKWYHHAISHWQPPDDAFVIRYEDVMSNPLQQLNRIGDYIGLKYTEESLSHWTEGHHQISGNVHATGSNIIQHDERWKRELSADNLNLFDKYCGEINASFGYQ